MPPPHRRTPAKRIDQHRRRRMRIDPIQLGRSLTKRKAAPLAIALVIIFVLAVLDRGMGLLPVADDWHRYDGKSFMVLRVVDGDTLILNVPDGEEAITRVRLWGVNTAEMNVNDPDQSPDPWAQEATDFTRQAVEGKQVTLHLQEHRLRGGYGRLLAYVQMPDGGSLNAALIEQGLSKHDERWGHDRASQFDQLQDKAREARRGIWGQ
ncbi:MAG: thermonuclease family protein [Phycisphaeraceae bacterium]